MVGQYRQHRFNDLGRDARRGVVVEIAEPIGLQMHQSGRSNSPRRAASSWPSGPRIQKKVDAFPPTTAESEIRLDGFTERLQHT
jgi:hypothetical protein